MKKNKLSNLHCTHGALVEQDATTLEKKCCKHHTNASNYGNLDKLSLSQLQSIAEDLGLLPIDNKDLLIKAIKKEIQF